MPARAYTLCLLVFALAAPARAELIVNGDFETGDLSGWTTFTTPNGTLGLGLPQVIPFDTDGDGAPSLAAVFSVGRLPGTPVAPEGGGILQNVLIVAFSSIIEPLFVWDARTGREVYRIEGHNCFVKDAAFSPDGRILLGGERFEDKKRISYLGLWNPARGKEIRRFIGHADSVDRVAFSHDGRHGLSASTDKTVRLWDIETGREKLCLQGHSGAVNNILFCPDGRRILSADHKSVRLWDIASGHELGHYEDPVVVRSVGVCADSSYALCISGDHKVIFLHLP